MSRNRIIAFFLICVLLTYATGCNNTESISVPSQDNSELGNLNKEYIVNVYEIPFVCFDLEGQFMEIEDIRWHVWIYEEAELQSQTVAKNPKTTEELRDLLKNCVAEVIRVPKELSPLFGLTLSFTGGQGYGYFGKDEDYFYYGTTHLAGMHVTTPIEEFALNAELVRTQVPEGVYIAELEEYVQSVYEHVKAFKPIGKGKQASPYWLYSTLVSHGTSPDYKGTLKDSNWVECVQWARSELLTYPEKYAYQEEQIKELLEHSLPMDGVIIKITDEEDVIDARAQLYAKAKISGSYATLEEFIVLHGHYEGKEEYEPVLWAYDFKEKEWWSSTYNYHVDITPTLEYYKEHCAN